MRGVTDERVIDESKGAHELPPCNGGSENPSQKIYAMHY
jgi:hypothetical protein